MRFLDNIGELAFRWRRLGGLIREKGADAVLISSLANNFYAAGRVFMGYTLITSEGRALFFVRRPVDAVGNGVVVIRKPADIAAFLAAEGLMPHTVLFEEDRISVGDYARLAPLFKGVEFVDGSSVMREARSVKSPFEVEMVRAAGAIHSAAYSEVPLLYEKGMTDRQLSLAVERRMRELGSLGLSRIAGDSMEIHVVTVLAGDNADTFSPYDFATTGAGVDVSLPMGFDNTVITDGMSVMVDGCANARGYLTDLTRVFAVGRLPDIALKAYETSLEIYRMIVSMLWDGTVAADIYHRAYGMAAKAGFSEYFMGHRQQAGFVGHGVGIELNEAPVIAPRSKDIIRNGMVIALEPKFVIPGVGVLGIENTVAVTPDGVVNLTPCSEELIQLT